MSWGGGQKNTEHAGGLIGNGKVKPTGPAVRGCRIVPERAIPKCENQEDDNKPSDLVFFDQTQRASDRLIVVPLLFTTCLRSPLVMCFILSGCHMKWLGGHAIVSRKDTAQYFTHTIPRSDC